MVVSEVVSLASKGRGEHKVRTACIYIQPYRE